MSPLCPVRSPYSFIRFFFFYFSDGPPLPLILSLKAGFLSLLAMASYLLDVE